MLIYPAIDLYNGKAVRLFKGDYAKMTVYNDDPIAVAKDFEAAGAECIHLVDLEGAQHGLTPNFEVVRRIKAETNLFCEIGGGIRSMNVVDAYIEAGLDRVILESLKYTIDELKATNQFIHPETIKAYDFLLLNTGD